MLDYFKKLIKEYDVKFIILKIDSESLDKCKDLKFSKISNINKLQNHLNFQKGYQNTLPEPPCIYQNPFYNPSSFFLYDGFLIQDVYRKFLNLNFNDEPAVVLTDKLLCTFDESDSKYHARTIVFGNPAIISFSGIIMGPARPREYHLKSLFYQNNDSEFIELLNYEYAEKFLDYDNPKINHAFSIFLVQYFYFIRDKKFKFCNNNNCILFNCHWQEDLLSLIEKGELCNKHLKCLNKFFKNCSNEFRTDY